MPDRILGKKLARKRRRKHILKQIRGTKERPRLVVHRSNKHIYAQIVDDDGRRTISTASSLSKDIAAEIKGVSKVEQAKEVGKLVAKLAAKKKVKSIIFDRAGYLYHGRVKALAEGAREGGLDF
ncbi:MAG: 50S ribosomal protein L18 [Calditrichaeota bacterium]|nr:50S ribosomal protein L18 [Calditrichota bacterium]